MKIKSIIAIALVAVLSLSVFVGCSNKGKAEGENVPSSTETKAESGQLSKVHEAVKGAYGEDYVPSMPFEEAQLEEFFGVKKDSVKEFVAEGPMMNVKVDTFVGIEANEGKAEEVETALKAYRTKMIEDKEQFPYLPDHLPKARASQVVRIDDYVFFIMLGNIPAETAEEDFQSAAEAEVKKAVDAIAGVLKK